MSRMSRMSSPSDTTSLASYWSGIHNALHGRLLSVQDYLRHPSTGVNAEAYFRDLLRQYLPHKYAVDSGFVVNATGNRSAFHDILIVDCHHIPPLSSEPHFKVFAAEAVVAAIEVTSAPKASVRKNTGKLRKLEDDTLKLAQLRQLAKERSYITSVLAEDSNGFFPKKVEVSYKLPPRTFLITCGDEWAQSATYEKHLLAALRGAFSKYGEDVWLNAVLSMKHGMFHFKPHTKFEHAPPRHQNALLEFLLLVNHTISNIPTYPIDLQRYRPTVPIESNQEEIKGLG